MNKKKLGLLYFGRLETEKGFDLILEMLQHFLKQGKKLPFKIFIFGDGNLRNQLLEIISKSEDIHYFGRKSLNEIKRYKDNCEYLLMPSKCLETFGLSALTACSRGLSVIGFKKGGQSQFIHSQYDISKITGNNDSKKLIGMIEKVLEEKKLPKTIKKAIAKNYTTQLRVHRFKEIVGEPQKILIINDYSEKKGGIETYIHDATELLQKEGYEIIILGKSKIPRQLRKKYYYMIGSIFNIRSYLTIKKMIKTFQPDSIWYHNMIRYHGRMGILAGKKSTAQKIVMYHDLGYFFPYPSQLENEKQIKYPTNPKQFFTSTPNRNIIKKLAARCKGVRNLPLQKQIKKQCTTHVVPSKFMESIVHKGFRIPKKKIISLPHFLQE